MKAIVNTAAGRVQWLDWPLPEPGPGQVRIRTAACGVCATDLHMIAGWWTSSSPISGKSAGPASTRRKLLSGPPTPLPSAGD
jgi:threonine dehydrogenase-like Zn-dependent dehydrogenase